MSEKAKPISRYELFENAPIRIQERALEVAEHAGIDLNEEGWEILHQEDTDLVGVEKPAHPTKDELIDGIQDVLPGLNEIHKGQWHEYTGAVLLNEDQAGWIMDAVKELETLVEKFNEQSKTEAHN